MISAKTAKAMTEKASRREKNIVLAFINATVKQKCELGFHTATVFFSELMDTRRNGGFYVSDNTMCPMPYEVEKALKEMGYTVEKKDKWYDIAW